MPQLVDDLPRRDAALSRRACHENVSAGPGGEIGERTGERDALDRVCRRFRRRIVDRRDNTKDVDRDVDAAGDRRDIRRLEMAGVIGAVGQDDDRAAASLALADAARRQRDRVVQRGLAERHQAVHGIGQRAQADGEGGALVQVRVERVDRRFVTRRVEPAQDVPRRFAGVRQVAFHAAADVEQHRHADCREVLL